MSSLILIALAYARSENLKTAFKRNIDSCEASGYVADDHVRGVTKMIEVGKGGHRLIDDFMSLSLEAHPQDPPLVSETSDATPLKGSCLQWWHFLFLPGRIDNQSPFRKSSAFVAPVQNGNDHVPDDVFFHRF